MPKIYSEKGFLFRFFASDKYEPMHVHIRKGSGNAKIWLEPTLKWAFCYGFKTNEQRDILTITGNNYDLFKQKWNEYFGSK